MKRVLFAFIITLSMSMLYGQATVTDVFVGEEMVWYGLDFTQARFIGQFDQAVGAAPASAYDLKTKYIPAWNELILAEATKYDLGKTFRKSKVYNDITVVERLNSRIEEESMLMYNHYNFENPQKVVSDCVQKYSGGNYATGLGVVFIVEYFNKEKQDASFYVTFFDIASRKVIFSERVVGRARGIGLRNYWGGAIYNALVQIQKTHFSAWKKIYFK